MTLLNIRNFKKKIRTLFCLNFIFVSTIPILVLFSGPQLIPPTQQQLGMGNTSFFSIPILVLLVRCHRYQYQYHYLDLSAVILILVSVNNFQRYHYLYCYSDISDIYTTMGLVEVFSSTRPIKLLESLTAPQRYRYRY